MFFLNSNLFQCFMCFLFLWPSIIDSFPSTSLTFNRYERDTSGAEFPTSGRLELVVHNDNGCNTERLTFCYPTSSPTQTGTSQAQQVGCNEHDTCAYSFKFNGLNSGSKQQASLFSKDFLPTSKCFTGKITSTDVYAYYRTTELAKVEGAGCQFEFDSKGRLVITILDSNHEGVTVTAKNAEKYVEPTPPPTSTSLPTETPKEVSSTQSKKKDKESGMSDAVKYTIFGVGALLLILVIGGAGFAIYWFCCKSKKSPKPDAPVVTVSKTDQQFATTPVIAKEEAAVPKPSEAKPKASNKKKVEKEESKADPTPSNVVSSVAEPPPPTASKEPAAPSKPDRKHPVLTPYRQPSTDLVQHFSQPKTPHALPAAKATIADLLGRAGQRGFRGRKFNDTFDKLRKPQYENIFDAMVRQKWISDDQAVNVKEKYRREISEDEIRLFSLPIGDMYPKLNEMIDEAAYYHKPHDEDAKCELIDNQFHTYFVSHYATVVHFARYFKIKENDKLTTYSIPLLFGIAMDRTQTEAVRRRALVEMTLKGIQLTKVNTEQQCLKMPYPMNVMCLSFQLDPYLLENEHRLHTFSSPNNSECTRSDASTKKTAGGQSTVTDEGNRRRRGNGGKKNSSSSTKAGGTKTSISKEMTLEKKKKKKGKRKQ